MVKVKTKIIKLWEGFVQHCSPTIVLDVAMGHLG